MLTHVLEVVQRSADGVALRCPSCGRTVVAYRRPASLSVLIQGDFSARHVGGSLGLSLSVATPASPA